jgi:hypothetical protein
MIPSAGLFILLPSGYRVNMAAVQSHVLSSATITFTYGSGSTYGETYATAGAAQYALGQIDQILATPNPGVNVPGVGPYTITSLSPNPFDVSSPGSGVITIIGTGFTAANIGTISFDDAAGGLDFNGYAWACTFVSSTEMTAVFSTVGDGVLGPGQVLITYKDSLGQLSNTIHGTNASGTVVSVP